MTEQILRVIIKDLEDLKKRLEDALKNHKEIKEKGGHAYPVFCIDCNNIYYKEYAGDTTCPINENHTVFFEYEGLTRKGEISRLIKLIEWLIRRYKEMFDIREND